MGGEGRGEGRAGGLISENDVSNLHRLSLASESDSSVGSRLTSVGTLIELRALRCFGHAAALGPCAVSTMADRSACESGEGSLSSRFSRSLTLPAHVTRTSSFHSEADSMV